MVPNNRLNAELISTLSPVPFSLPSPVGSRVTWRSQALSLWEPGKGVSDQSPWPVVNGSLICQIASGSWAALLNPHGITVYASLILATGGSGGACFPGVQEWDGQNPASALQPGLPFNQLGWRLWETRNNVQQSAYFVVDFVREKGNKPVANFSVSFIGSIMARSDG